MTHNLSSMAMLAAQALVSAIDERVMKTLNLDGIGGLLAQTGIISQGDTIASNTTASGIPSADKSAQLS